MPSLFSLTVVRSVSMVLALEASALAPPADAPAADAPSRSETARDPWWPGDEDGREVETAREPESAGAADSRADDSAASPTDHGMQDGASADGATTRPTLTAAPPLRKASPSVLRVAIGLGAAAPGTMAERAWLDRLEGSVRASTDPIPEVTRLALGSVADRSHCRLGSHDLVIAIDHLPGEDGRAIIDAWDCGLDMGLSIHEIEELESPELLGELWREHDRRIAEGAKVRKRKTLSRKAKTALAITGALAVTAIAVGVLLGTTLQQDRVVLNVAP